ncbi:DNA-directed RNA polymerase I subunit rpa49 [Sphaceloma murrayae]|uniref:DNA-directed RNA polymerase I subunit rpa49 n=1 Tax=Sphaceloma murrayae TaxID=2082308 RepID=A0A2K1QL77_9PEZI|nr:DNA-directed RNA polymerase I subunit rpa49 [Sphaceloma murrayae]
MSEKEKKRKRVSASEQRASKRRSIDGGTSITVSIRQSNGKLCPVLAASPGIQLKPLKFETYSKEKISNDDEAALHPTSSSVLLRSSEHPLLDFTASPDEKANVMHYLGIYDSDSRTIQLVPAHPTTARGTLRSEAAEVHAENEKVAGSKAKQREELGLEFGTKKAKKAINSKTVNAISGVSAKGVEDAIMNDVGDAAAGIPGRSQREDEILKSKPIPRPNLDAKQPQDVYPISILIHPGDLRSIAVKDWQDSVKAGTSVELKSRFVANRLAHVAAKGNVQMLKALKYLLLLIEFVGVLKVAGKTARKVPPNEQLKSRLSEWPETLVDNVRRKFAQGGDLNKWHLDNLMTHMAALSLYIDAFRTDTHDLREDLHLENKQMSQYFHELGCRIRAPTEREYQEFRIANKAQAAQRKVAQLRLPLDFPKTRNPPRR